MKNIVYKLLAVSENLDKLDLVKESQELLSVANSIVKKSGYHFGENLHDDFLNFTLDELNLAIEVSKQLRDVYSYELNVEELKAENANQADIDIEINNINKAKEDIKSKLSVDDNNRILGLATYLAKNEVHGNYVLGDGSRVKLNNSIISSSDNLKPAIITRTLGGDKPMYRDIEGNPILSDKSKGTDFPIAQEPQKDKTINAPINLELVKDEVLEIKPTGTKISRIPGESIDLNKLFIRPEKDELDSLNNKVVGLLESLRVEFEDLDEKMSSMLLLPILKIGFTKRKVSVEEGNKIENSAREAAEKAVEDKRAEEKNKLQSLYIRTNKDLSSIDNKIVELSKEIGLLHKNIASRYHKLTPNSIKETVVDPDTGKPLGAVRSDTLAMYHAQQMTNILNESRDSVKVLRIKNKTIKYYKSLESLNVGYEMLVDDIKKESSNFLKIDEILSKSPDVKTMIERASLIVSSVMDLLKDKASLDKQKNRILSLLESFAGEVSETDIINLADSNADDVIYLKNKILKEIDSFSEYIESNLLIVPDKIKQFISSSKASKEKKAEVLKEIEGKISLAQRPKDNSELVKFLMNKVVVNTKFVNSIINNRNDLSEGERKVLLSDKEAALEFIVEKNPRMASYLFYIKENPIKAVKTDLYQNFLNISSWAKKSMVDALVRERIMNDPLFNNDTFGVDPNQLATSNLNQEAKKLRSKSPQLAANLSEVIRNSSKDVTEFLNSDTEYKKLKNAIEYKMYYDFEYNINSNLEKRYDTYTSERKVASKIWNIKKQAGDSNVEGVKVHTSPGESEKADKIKQRQFDPSKFTSSPEEQKRLQELFNTYEKQWVEFYDLQSKFANDPTNIFGLNGSISDRRPSLQDDASEAEKSAFLKARDNGQLISYSKMSENKTQVFDENVDISKLVLSTITLPDSETESEDYAKVGIGFSQEQLAKDVLSKLLNVTNSTLSTAGEGLDNLYSYAKELDVNKIKSIFNDIFNRFSKSAGNPAKSSVRSSILNVSRAIVQLPSKQRDYTLYPKKPNEDDLLLSSLIRRVYLKHCKEEIKPKDGGPEIKRGKTLSEQQVVLLSNKVTASKEAKNSVLTEFFNQNNANTIKYNTNPSSRQADSTEQKIKNFLEASKDPSNNDVEMTMIELLKKAANIDPSFMKINAGLGVSDILVKILGALGASLNSNYNGSVYDIFEVTSKVNLTDTEKSEFAKLIQNLFFFTNMKAQNIGSSLDEVSRREAIEIANNDDVSRSLMKILNANTDQTLKFGDDIDTRVKTLFNSSSKNLDGDRMDIVLKTLTNSVGGTILVVNKDAKDEDRKNQEIAKTQSMVTVLNTLVKQKLTEKVLNKIDFESKEFSIDRHKENENDLYKIIQELYSTFGLTVEENYQMYNLSMDSNLYRTLYNFATTAKFKVKKLDKENNEIVGGAEEEVDAKQKLIRILRTNSKYASMLKELSESTIDEYFGKIFEPLPIAKPVMPPDLSNEPDENVRREKTLKYEEDKNNFLKAQESRNKMSKEKVLLLKQLLVLLKMSTVDKQVVRAQLGEIKNKAINVQDERLDRRRLNEIIKNTINLKFETNDIDRKLLSNFISAFTKYVYRTFSGKENEKYLDMLAGNEPGSEAISYDTDLKNKVMIGDSKAVKTLISRALQDGSKLATILLDILDDLANKAGTLISDANAIQKMLTFLKTKGILADIAAEKEASRKETITKLATDWIEKRISFFEEAAKKFFIKLKDKKPETYFEMAKFRKPEEMAAALTTALKKEVAKATSDDEKRKIIHQMVNKLDERSQEIYTTHRVALPKNDKELHSVTRVAMEDFISNNMHLLQNTDRYDGCSFSAILSDILGSDKLLPEKNKSAKYPITLDGKPIRRYKAPLLFSIFGKRGKDLVIETREKTYRMPELQIKMNNLEASPEEIIEKDAKFQEIGKLKNLYGNLIGRK